MRIVLAVVLTAVGLGLLVHDLGYALTTLRLLDVGLVALGVAAAAAWR